MKRYSLVVDRDREKEWDKFVVKNDGSVYHLYAWSKICRESLGYESQYRADFERDKITAIYPFLVRGRIFRRICAMPFSDGIGPLGKLKLHSDIEQFFVEKEVVKGQKLSRSHSLFSLLLGKPYEEIFRTSYHHKTRNIVRKAQKEGVKTSVEKLNNANIAVFYSLYLATMKKLGTLAVPKSLFEAVNRHLSQKSVLVAAYVHRKPAAFLWLFNFNERTFVWANASEESLLGTGVNYAVYDEAIKYAISRRHQEIVLGASEEDSSQAFFKRRWGALEKAVFTTAHSGVSFPPQKLVRVLPFYVYRPFCQLAFKIA